MSALDVGDTLVHPFRVVFADYPVFLRTLGPVLAVGLGLAIVSSVLMGETAPGLDEVPEDPAAVLALTLPLVAVSGLVSLLSLIVGVIVTGVGLVVADAALDGAKPDLATAWRGFAPRLGHLILLTLALAAVMLGIGVTTVLVSSVVFVGAAASGFGGLRLLALVPVLGALAVTVWLAVTWVLAAPALVLDGHGVMRSLSEARERLTGNWWRAFAVLFVLVVAFALVGGAVATLVAPGLVLGPAASPGTSTLVLQDVVGFLVSLVSAPVMSTAIVLLYRRLGAPDAPAPAENSAGFAE